MPEQLIHFSAQPLGDLYDVEQKPLAEDSRPFKPRGLWISVEGNDDGWKSWCEGEQFSLPSLARSTEIILAESAKILRISAPDEIDKFTDEYGITDWPHGMGLDRDFVYAIDWPRIAKFHDGIIITPYCWERRLELRTTWYYTWDCASGCIWNAKAIKEARPLPSELDRQ